MAEEKLIRLKADNVDETLIAWADCDKVTQILTNLISNAIKFTPVGGEIKIEGQEYGPGWLQISVSDTGPGIAPEQTAKIFDEFYQLQQSGEKSWRVGLGLAISKKLVEMHGGKIWVRSELAKGSSFFYTPQRNGAAHRRFGWLRRAQIWNSRARQSSSSMMIPTFNMRSKTA
jgi:signal transduction histidine kinase